MTKIALFQSNTGIEPEANGWLYSEQLQLYLVEQGEEFRFFDLETGVAIPAVDVPVAAEVVS